jgi:hypothetical protein
MFGCTVCNLLLFQAVNDIGLNQSQRNKCNMLHISKASYMSHPLVTILCCFMHI